jgi:ABC-type phosphate transport system substrate-binding protein
MTRRRAILVTTLTAAVIALAARGGGAETAHTGGLVIIVHPSNRVASVDRAFLRDAFLRKVVTWGGGETIRPVDLARRNLLRDRFTRDILKKSPTQLRSFWNRQIFTGTGMPPVERATEAGIIAYVLANRGAIGYLPEGVDPRGARVVRLR